MRPLVALVLGLLAVACMPRYITPGPSVTLPRLNERSVLMPDGATLALRSWTAERPHAVIVALHGFNAYGNVFAEAGAWLSKAGVATYALDQRGFGDSPPLGRWPGANALIDDLDTLVELLHARYPGVPVYVLGESMGGAVAVVWAATKGKGKAQGLMLAAPAVWGWQALKPAYKTVLFIAAHTLPWAKVTGRHLDIWPSDNIEMLRALSRDPKVIKKTRVDAIYGLVTLMDEAYADAGAVTCQTLLLYGQHDQVIPAAPVQHVAAALGSDGRYVLYPKGYHMLLHDLQRETVWKDVLAFVDNPAAALPSGDEHSLNPSRGLQPAP
jgi:alpha-beta hydrolase superfamily lysophospholipase